MTRARAIRPPWTAETIALLGTIPDPVISARTGIPLAGVKAERRRRRIKPATGGPKPQRGAVADVPRTIKLTRAEADAQDAAARAAGVPWTQWAISRLSVDGAT